MKPFTLLVGACLVWAVAGADSGSRPAPRSDRVGFPTGYTNRFQVLRQVVRTNDQRIVTVFGNAEAASVSNAVQLPYPNGSVLVMETAQVRKDAAGQPALDAQGGWQKGAVSGLHVMRKEQGFGREYGPSQAGDWEYVEYAPDRTYLTPPAQSAPCAECHRQAGAEWDYVFHGRLSAARKGAGSSSVTNSTPARADRAVQDKCTTILVGRLATADGSVLLGHNEDWGEYVVPLRWNRRETHSAGETLALRSGQMLPQVEQTFAFLWPAADCNGINEFQVMITDNTGSGRKELVPDGRGIEMEELVRITLQRSKTARQAIETMGRLLDQCGYRCVDGPSGDIFSVADPSEGWWMEVTAAGQWAAQKVPDDSFVVLANRFRIGTIHFKDATRFLVRSNLIDYASKRGWYDPAEGPFHFARAYGRPAEAGDTYSSRREWRANALLSGKAFQPEENALAVVPLKKLAPRDLMGLLRDHYEGTAYDLTQGYEKGSPHRTAERTICILRTDASTVAHLRSWLPPAIGGVLWFSAGTPCSSGYVPYYLGTEAFPKPFTFVTGRSDPLNGFWVFNALENLADHYYAEPGRSKRPGPRAIDRVSAFWKEFEANEFASQPAIEKTALKLFAQDPARARSFLTEYASALGQRAFVAAQELADDLRTAHDR